MRGSWRAVSMLALLALALAGALPTAADKGDDDAASGPLPPLAEKTAGLTPHEGLLTFYTDADHGRVWLALPPPDAAGVIGRYLYLEGIVTGIGSNDIGVDRGQQSDGQVLTVRRVGGKVLFVAENQRFRALSDDPEERRAVEEAFADSVLWGGAIAARDEAGGLLVDWTSFLVRDAHGIAATLDRSGQGSFKLDAARSAVDPAACLAFPDNVELEAIVTLTSDAPGRLVSATVPEGGAVTVRQHHSLVRLPDDGYRPRVFDPRAGSFPITFLDYAAPLDAALTQRWIVRHRLEKTDPAAASSPVVEPIVYYVDSGTPEPIRGALIEGASWWADAFAAAGFEDAYRVEVLPPGAHPLDVRYNVIQWVHRSTRGWSYGGGVTDPRTGERIKGHVWLGSLRVRQDRLLFEGLAGTAATGSGSPDDPVQLALARIRQLAAHEVGHALGLAHNFAASTYGGRASVMDYPAPLVGITPHGELDFNQAYGVGMGAWDRHAIEWAYRQWPDGTDEAAALDALVAAAIAGGLRFVADDDSRPAAAAHPYGSLWDNGEEPVAALEQTLRVRQIALARFGPGNVAPGRPLAELEEVLATVYLHHRYQLAAALKVLGGVEYRYNLRGDGQPLATIPDAAWQRRALDAVLATLAPEALDLPDEVLAVVLPRPSEFAPNREMFGRRGGRVFDPLAAAATAARLTVDGLLDPQRAVRLIDQARRDPELPGFETVLDAVQAAVFPEAVPAASRHAELLRGVQSVVVDRLQWLAASPEVAPAVRTRAEQALRRLRYLGAAARAVPEPERGHRRTLASDIERFLGRPWHLGETGQAGLAPPPGSPIGAAATAGCSASP